MNVDVKILKKEVIYQKDGVDKRATNYFICVNDLLIPIEVKYFPNDKFGGRDPAYQGRVSALSIVAQRLPSKEELAKMNPEKIACPKCGKFMRVDDKDGNEYYLECDDCNIGGNFFSNTGETYFTDADGNPIN